MMNVRFWIRILCVAVPLAAVPAVRAEDVPLSLDDEYAQMAGRVHGFGGLYVDVGRLWGGISAARCSWSAAGTTW